MALTKLSVNVNKIALLRNSRGGHQPNVLEFAQAAVRAGAQGITVHPRPDARHIRRHDVRILAEWLSAPGSVEFNIEGYPTDEFLELVQMVRPTQCTLVPDPPEALTSSAGWDTYKRAHLLREVCDTLREWGVRSALFLEPNLAAVDGALAVGADRIELYTGPYAHNLGRQGGQAADAYALAAAHAAAIGLGINAGHDLNLQNLAYFLRRCPQVQEVSIGHALVADALYLGLDTTIRRYRQEIAAA